MAETVILRPNSDISGGSGTDYLKISETKADNEETTIGVDSAETEQNESITYVFGLEELQVKKINVKSVKIVYCYYLSNSTSANASASGTISLTCIEDLIMSLYLIEDTSNEYLTKEYYADSSTLDILQNHINENGFMLPPLQLGIELKASYSVNEGMAQEKSGSIYVTQAYVEIEYEELLNNGIFDKVGGVYKATMSAYRKVNGAWSEISEDEAKATIKNNTIRRVIRKE